MRLKVIKFTSKIFMKRGKTGFLDVAKQGRKGICSGTATVAGR